MNKQQRENRMNEIEKERLAQLREQMAEQLRIEQERQNTALLNMAVESLKGNGKLNPAEVVSFAKELRSFVKGEPQFTPVN